MARSSSSANNGGKQKVLTSWKEIAAFFGKGVRTVQRWEKLGMPVHRPTTDRNIVFADPQELLHWAIRSDRDESNAAHEPAAN